MLSKWRAAPVFAAAFLTSALAVSGAFAAQAAAPSKEYTPSVGQEGKDVIWVPTPQALVERMLQMAGTKPTDYVVDLGSGDGRTVITAAKKFGTRALGVEFNPDMVKLAQKLAAEGGRGRPRHLCPGRHVRSRHLQGHSAGAVPDACEPRTPRAEVPRLAPRHTHRRQHVRHSQLDAGRDGSVGRALHELVHRDALQGAATRGVGRIARAGRLNLFRRRQGGEHVSNRRADGRALRHWGDESAPLRSPGVRETAPSESVRTRRPRSRGVRSSLARAGRRGRRRLISSTRWRAAIAS